MGFVSLFGVNAEDDYHDIVLLDLINFLVFVENGNQKLNDKICSFRGSSF